MSIIFLPSLLFLSFFPLWVSIVFIDTLSIIESDANIWTEVISLILIGLGMLISSSTVIRQMRQQTNYIRSTIEKASKQKTITAEYLLSYILPLFAFDFTKWRQVVLFLIFFTTLAFLCLKHHYVYANIILEIWGYTCYDCTMINSDDSKFETVVVSANELTGMFNHRINYVSLGGGYGLNVRSPNA